MMDQPHGRYFAQQLLLEEDAEVGRSIRDALDAGERRKWHLVRVSDVPWGAVSCCSGTSSGHASAGPPSSDP